MGRNFRKDGVGRTFEAVAKSLRGPTSRGSVTTGLIEQGEVVTVEFDGSSLSATAQVKSRRTGAILIYSDITGHDYQGHTISDNLLTVNYSSAATGTCRYWVF